MEAQMTGTSGRRRVVILSPPELGPILANAHSVNRQNPGFTMRSEREPLGEKAAQGGAEFLTRSLAPALPRDIEAIAVQPIRPIDDLQLVNVVGLGDQGLQGRLLRLQ